MDDEGFIFQADLGPILDHPVLSFRPLFRAFLLLQNVFEGVIVFDLFRYQRFHLSIRHLNCWYVLHRCCFFAERTRLKCKDCNQTYCKKCEKVFFTLVLSTNYYDSTKLHTSLQPLPSTNPLHIFHLQIPQNQV